MPSLKQVASMSFLYCSMAWLTRSLAPPAAEGASCLIVTGCRGGGLFWNIGGGGGASIGLCCSKTCLNSGWVMADTENMTKTFLYIVTQRLTCPNIKTSWTLKAIFFYLQGAAAVGWLAWVEPRLWWWWPWRPPAAAAASDVGCEQRHLAGEGDNWPESPSETRGCSAGSSPAQASLSAGPGETIRAS